MGFLLGDHESPSVGDMPYWDGTKWVLTKADPTNHKARAHPSAGQSFGAGGGKVTLDVEDYDPGSHFADSKYTVALAGKYLICASAGLINLAATTVFKARVFKNGAYAFGATYQAQSTTDDPSAAISDILDLAVDDEIELYVSHNIGGDRNTDPAYCWLSVHLLSI
ncbi:hypothetical protein ES703_58789 [subsurface metagenome]